MRKKLTRSALAALLGCLVGSTALFADDAAKFPFVIQHGAQGNITNVKTWDNPLPSAGSRGFLGTKDGRFAFKSGDARFLGTNLCFGANFPDKENAEFLARSLSRFGIGVVRLHHMDSRDIWGANFEKTRTEIDPKQLDKLDYMIYCLQKEGVYVNINLHVSRAFDERDGFENSKDLPTQNKGVDNFDPRMIELQKKYARDLLTHVNPYTGKAYVDDPGVAVIEINNENSVVASWSWGELDNLPSPYCDEFQRLWNAWLTKKYKSTAKLRAAWNSRDYPTGPEQIADGKFAPDFKFSRPWELQLDETAKTSWRIVPASETGIDANALRLDVEKVGAVNWIPQIHRVGLGVEKGTPYRLTFKIRSESESKISVGVVENHDPWQPVGVRRDVTATKDWQTVSIPFLPTKSDDQIRVSFGSFQDGTSIEIADLSLRSGGTLGVDASQTLEAKSIPVPKRNGDSGTLFSPETIADFSDFLRDLENKYWQEMHRFVKDELGAKQPVAGTQLQYGFWHAQARLDFCDIHAYWNHPNFPGRSWDQNHWLVGASALANSPANGTLSNLAAVRVLGSPFTCSEYDHPFPNPYAAEGNVMLAAVAAFQDWSAIYQFAWSHSSQYQRDAMAPFFDMCAQPMKTAHLPACYGMFVRGDVKSGPGEYVYKPSMTQAEESQIQRDGLTGYHRSLQGLNLDRSLSLAVYAGIELPDLKLPTAQVESAKEIKSWADLPARFGSKEKKEIVNEHGEIRWNFATPDKGYFVVDSANTKVFSGFVTQPTQFDGVTLDVGATELGWATVSLVKGTNVDLDAEKVGKLTSGRYLLTATGAMQNTDAKLVKVGKDVTTAGRYGGSNGRAPVLCEGVPATLTLNGVDAKSVSVFALDESGARKGELSVESTADGARFGIGPESKTIWYEVVIK